MPLLSRTSEKINAMDPFKIISALAIPAAVVVLSVRITLLIVEKMQEKKVKG